MTTTHCVEFSALLHHLYTVLNAPEISLEQQAECVNDLFLFLDTHHHHNQFPARFLWQAIQIFQWYLEALVPEEQYDEFDFQAVTEDYQRMLTALHKSLERSRRVEKHLARVIERLRTGEFTHEQDALAALLQATQGFVSEIQVPAHSMLRCFRKGIHDGLGRDQIFKFFERFFRVLRQENAFVQPLFSFQELCEDTLQTYFQGKTVLVDITRQGFIIPMQVVVDQHKTSENVEFSRHKVDVTMQSSANTARTLACQYLQSTCQQNIDETLWVRCHFSFPAAGYRDTSASLLLAVQIVGEVLNLEHAPTTVVTGEISEEGSILRVGWIQEKINAVDADARIERIIIPAGNLHDVSAHLHKEVSIIPVRSLSEALEHYYGESLQKKLRQYSRRQVLKRVTGFIAAPFLFSGIRHVLTRCDNVVTECDWRLLSAARDLYQKESHYQHAVIILDSILERFARDHSSAEARRIRAFALGQLGVIHLQQRHIQASLQAFRKAELLWKSLHDREYQADLLFRIGEVYRYTVVMDDRRRNTRRGLQAYHHARELLNPSMELYTRLQGKYYALTGYMYYWNGEYELAEQYGRQAIMIFEEPESNWTYQTARQHLSRTLIQNGQHDEAYDILQDTAQANVLQGPYDQARNTLALSELYFTGGDREKGLEHAAKVRQLCQDFSLQGQQRILHKMLKRYGVTGF